jgi:hypothetical protein
MISKAVPARAHTRTFAVGIDYITEHTHQRALATVGHGFEDGVAYASASEKAAWVHLRGVMSVDTAAIEMGAVAALSSRCRDPVYHLIVAYAKHERPTREQVVSDAERLLKAIGMGDHQYVLAAHKDTDDVHAHVIANRVGLDGKANDLWHERIIRERVCAEIAAERGWDIVVGHHNRDIVQRIEQLHEPPANPPRRLSDGAYRRLHERGELPWQESARPYVLDAVERAKDWRDLHERLGAHGVVVKVVRRGDRILGLAFSEGLDRHAPGCAASRIDRSCSLSTLERRFGPFTQTHEPIAKPVSPTLWSDTVRPTILAAVDASKSWDDLAQRLERDGITIKLIQRGGYVQGLAFAQGRDADAPGCGASRIHPRCKKATLEQRFGPFPREAQQRHERSRGMGRERQANGRSGVRERAEREAGTDPRWALRDAERIVDHARMRSEYTAYRDRCFAHRDRTSGARRNAAWELERARRQREAQRRCEARRLLRAVARLGTRGFIPHQLAYWSIDVMTGRRRAQEHDAARVRWEATKIVLASERKLAHKEKPMDYRSFVTQRARAGDPAAARLLDTLAPPTRQQRPDPPRTERQRVTLHEVRTRLEVIRAQEQARYEQARDARRGLGDVEKPRSLDDVLAVERQHLREQTAHATGFTDAERTRLAQLGKQKRSWNPLTQALAVREEAVMQAAHRSRFEKAAADAMRDFEQRDLPQISERLASDEKRYHQYATASIKLERRMIEARERLDRIPQTEHQLTVLERAGVSHVPVHDPTRVAGLAQLTAAIDQHYRSLPETRTREVERALHREERAHDRSRDFSMGGL